MNRQSCGKSSAASREKKLRDGEIGKGNFTGALATKIVFSLTEIAVEFERRPAPIPPSDLKKQCAGKKIYLKKKK
jgi:hypothetical protein